MTFPPSARDDAVALLRVAGLDFEMDRLRLQLGSQGMHADLARALKRDESDVLALSSELQQKTSRLAEERDAVLARISLPLRTRYVAAMQDGLRPALAAVHDGRCPGCGQPLADASRWLLQQSLRVLPCSGCLRLLYDRGWVERDLMPSTLRPVTRGKP